MGVVIERGGEERLPCRGLSSRWREEDLREKPRLARRRGRTRRQSQHARIMSSCMYVALVAQSRHLYLKRGTCSCHARLVVRLSSMDDEGIKTYIAFQVCSRWPQLITCYQLGMRATVAPRHGGHR